MEVAQTLKIMEGKNGANASVVTASKKWFSHYLQWVTTHQYGIDEMNAANNHGTCWVMQVACFARFTGNDALLSFCRERYQTVLLPHQMAQDGSFPKEIARTKPYGYSIFNLDAMAMTAFILTNTEHNTWSFTVSENRSVTTGIRFLFPFIKNKNTWPYPKDVMYWENWPVAPPFLAIGALLEKNEEWLNTWEQLSRASDVPEVIRNLPVRNLMVWMGPN